MPLRPYQRLAVDSIYAYFCENKKGNPLVVAPTGSGKSHLIAEFCREVLDKWPRERILVLAHRKELLQQNTEKILTSWPMAPIGIYSAGLKKRELGNKITMAGVQSVYKRAKEIGWVSLILVDEAHLIPHRAEGMYVNLLEDLKKINPNVKVIGFTATPFRMSGGLLTDDHTFFTDICYDIRLTDLIDQKFLSPLVSKSPVTQADLSSVRVRGGEFVAAEAEAVMDQEILTNRALDEVQKLAEGRKSFLFFCAGVDHAEHVALALKERNMKAECVVGDTEPLFRDQYLREFKRGEISAITNCDVLTTGFDAPNIDCLVLLRPTKSVGLYVQMVGRGSRLSPATGKKDCLVLDFAGNIERHGPVDKVRVRRTSSGSGTIETAPTKVCPECRYACLIALNFCPSCGYEFPKPERDMHDTKASTAAILSNQEEPENHEVFGVQYSVHTKTNKPDSMRVCYSLTESKLALREQSVSEWVCFEHGGYAAKKAAQWWIAHHRYYAKPETRTNIKIPATVEEALDRLSELRTPVEVVTREEGKFTRVLGCKFKPIEKDEEQLPDWLDNPQEPQNEKPLSLEDIF